jgi:hypothetical protein
LLCVDEYRLRTQMMDAMKTPNDATTQALVFSVVATGFTTIYITQPVLPVIRDEFAVDAKTASLTVSVVILGIALANLPFGVLADRWPIKPIILAGRNRRERRESLLRAYRKRHRADPCAIGARAVYSVADHVHRRLSRANLTNGPA